MIAAACSVALPKIGSKIMLRKLTDKPHESDASCSDSHFYRGKVGRKCVHQNFISPLYITSAKMYTSCLTGLES